jgi:hypothetical protein
MIKDKPKKTPMKSLNERMASKAPVITTPKPTITGNIKVNTKNDDDWESF